jgi:hypothetical protein
MINYISSTYFEGNLEKMKEHNFLLQPNMFVGYIAIGNMLKKVTDVDIATGDVADKLMTIKEDLDKKFKLNSRLNDEEIRKVYKYFETIAKEVI